LSRLGQTTVSSLPVLDADERKKSIADIFSPALVSTTVLVTLVYFLHIITFYFLLKWAPQIVAGMKFPDSSAGRVLAMSNMGGAAGGAMFGLMTRWFGLKPLTIGILALNAVAVAVFGQTPAELSSLTMLAMVVGFCGNAAVSGLYSIVAYAFPTHVRATGTGFVIGVGRGGAVLSPILAGYLFNIGMSLSSVALWMGIGSLVAAIVLVFFKVSTSMQSAEDANKRANYEVGNLKPAKA
jgi:MFS family permease